MTPMNVTCDKKTENQAIMPENRLWMNQAIMPENRLWMNQAIMADDKEACTHMRKNGNGTMIMIVMMLVMMMVRR